MPKVRLICLDVDGTISDRFREPAVPGVAEALATLRQHYPVKLVTNATSLSHGHMAEMLARQKLLTEPADLITPATAARRVLSERGHTSGRLLIEEAAGADFEWFREDPDGDAVLVGTEAHGLTIADLQPAFRLLLDGAPLYTLQRNRYYRKGADLVTDLGPVAAFLSYASEREIINLGKPSPLLFEALARDAGCNMDQVLMVGDDAEFDASGSVALGMQGVLVRTGKYRPGDERRFDPPPTVTLDSVVELPGWLRVAGRHH